jgi:hypothetical protein
METNAVGHYRSIQEFHDCSHLWGNEYDNSSRRVWSRKANMKIHFGLIKEERTSWLVTTGEKQRLEDI